MKTTLQPTTPRMGDMINLEGETAYALHATAEQFRKAGAEIHESITPSKDHGHWLCWTENNTLELGEKSEHVECLMDSDCAMRILELDKHFNLCERVEQATSSTNRTAYADNINYYKRMIQQGTYPQNKLTRDQALQKLGYWEGRYDELTAGGGE